MPCVFQDVRVAGDGFEVFQQLRTVPVPGEADTANDMERAARQAAPGLRRGTERPRLAVCGRPLQGHRPDRPQGKDRRGI